MFMKISSSNSSSIFSKNYFSDSFANASSSSFPRLHLGGARIDRALGELEFNVLFGGATPPQYDRALGELEFNVLFGGATPPTIWLSSL